MYFRKDWSRMSDYISIKEFAERVGVSQQAIYKQLNNRLSKYVVLVEKKKMLHLSALDEFKPKEISTTVEQQLLNQLNNQLKDKDNEISFLKEQIQTLNKLLDQEQQLRMVNEQKLIMIEQKNQEDQERKRWQFWKRRTKDDERT